MAQQKFGVKPSAARGPVILAMDVGSSGSRAGLYDAAGRPIRGMRLKVPHAFTTEPDGTAIIDPDQIVGELSLCMTDLTGRWADGRIAAVALDTFASSLVGVDAEGRAVTPCYTYADSRCAPQVAALRAEVDEAEHQQRTGTRLHTSYLIPRFRWLRETQPALFSRVARWMSLGEYVYLRVLGTTAAGTSTAAWTGMLDRRTGSWDEHSLDLAGVTREQLSDVHDPADTLQPATSLVAQRWPALVDARWFCSISDGHASNLGAGGCDASKIVASASTSGAMRLLVEEIPDEIPTGLWCCRLDQRRSLLGGALNDVGRAVTWLQHSLFLPPREELHAALLSDPDPLTPLVLPFFTGERSTGWAGGARAAISGVSIAATGVAIYRGTLEGVALSYERVARQLRAHSGAEVQILAAGRVSLDVPPLLQLMADALDTPVTPVLIPRCTMHGTALHALEVVAPDVERVVADRGESCVPRPERRAYYEERKAMFQHLYEAII